MLETDRREVLHFFGAQNLWDFNRNDTTIWTISIARGAVNFTCVSSTIEGQQLATGFIYSNGKTKVQSSEASCVASILKLKGKCKKVKHVYRYFTSQLTTSLHLKVKQNAEK